MFGRRRRWIEEHGTEAEAVVTDLRVEAFDGGARQYRFSVQVHRPDGGVTDARFVEPATKLVEPLVGTVLPVRFDPADPSEVHLDYGKLGAATAAAKDEAVKLAEAVAAVPPDLREHGLYGRATVTTCVTESTDGQSATIVLHLAYRTDGMPRREATCRQTIAAETAAKLNVGAILSVRVDPADPTRVAFAPSEPLRPVTVLEEEMLGPIARAATEGTSCTATVGIRARQYLRTPDGRELFSAALSEGGASFQALVVLPVGVTALEHEQRITGRRVAASPADYVVL